MEIYRGRDFKGGWHLGLLDKVGMKYFIWDAWSSPYGHAKTHKVEADSVELAFIVKNHKNWRRATFKEKFRALSGAKIFPIDLSVEG